MAPPTEAAGGCRTIQRWRYNNQLAKDYGVAKSTIIGILRMKKFVVRRQPLASEQVSEAARLYESGMSLSQVAARVAVNQETMRVATLKAGVALREPTKAKQS